MQPRNKRQDNNSTNRSGNDFVNAPILAATTLQADNNFQAPTMKHQESAQHNHPQANEEEMISEFFTSKDLDLDSLLSSDEISVDDETFTAVDTDSDGYISQEELLAYTTSLKESLNAQDMTMNQFKEALQNLGIIPDKREQDFEEATVVTTENGYETTIDGDSNLDNAILITLDDTSSSEDAITVNLLQEDSSDQIIDFMLVDGIEDVTLNVVEDSDNSTDDLVAINQLVLDGTETLSITSQESIMISNIKSDSLQTIDLTHATGGFEIRNVESENTVTFKVSDLGDGIGKINFDSDNDDVLDASVSVIGLNRGVEDVIEFGETSLDNSFLINNIELGSDENSDTIDLSALGITLDDLTFTDGDFYSTEITSDSFDGSIILTGVSSDQIDTSNIVFE